MSSDRVQANRPAALADEAELDELLDSSGTVLVEFYTEGCGICQSMEPVLGVLARTTDVTVATVNPRDDPVLVDRFQVQSVPLFVLFVDGEAVARRADGFVGADDLREWIDDNR
jgi:thioredoxin-like negative regulator of GroEL